MVTDNFNQDTSSNYDKLILRVEGENFDYANANLYTRLIGISNYVASLTDGNALLKFQKIRGLQL